MDGKQKHVEILRPEISFEFTIPDDLPPEHERMYAWEKLRRICRGLSEEKGVKVVPVIPPGSEAPIRYPLRENQKP